MISMSVVRKVKVTGLMVISIRVVHSVSLVREDVERILSIIGLCKTRFPKVALNC